ncbi:hypothetical protein GK047_17660 [Paenibacillus sp. SYP-B3998]|uniref:Uncharacterized protein n=1 Tax=Paenibacillus sp. SYP-B3998 TaxID=2678564 RepID=A0A6G4A1X4_9BACL|nr:hypothetical protein [Paenibacillus sp. SYP-B3998]NEW07829.1 hypothetical protein [Paenibacillus sp. SYP-B3998]
MSQLLAHLYLFCDKTKSESKKLSVTRYTHVKEVTEHSCNSIEFEMTSYESLNMIENRGEKVFSFMLQDCAANYEGKSAKIFHLNKLYLAFDFGE